MAVLAISACGAPVSTPGFVVDKEIDVDNRCVTWGTNRSGTKTCTVHAQTRVYEIEIMDDSGNLVEVTVDREVYEKLDVGDRFDGNPTAP